MLHYTARDVEALTVGEFDLLCRWLDDYAKKVKEASRG